MSYKLDINKIHKYLLLLNKLLQFKLYVKSINRINKVSIQTKLNKFIIKFILNVEEKHSNNI